MAGRSIRGRLHKPAAQKEKRANSNSRGEGSSASHPMLHLQQAAGNAVVSRMVAEQQFGLLAKMQPMIGPEGGVLDGSLAARIRSERGMGSPLDEGMRKRMEETFQTDLSDVRIHTDASAHELSQALGAKAFTIGKDVFFHRDASPQDSRLLAHELAHVVQQSDSGTVGTLEVGRADDQMEREAERMAAEVEHTSASPSDGRAPAQATEPASPVVQRGIWDFLSTASGPAGLAVSTLTGLAERSNRGWAEMAGITAREATSIPGGLGVIGRVANPIGLISGAQDLFGSGRSVAQRVQGGLGAFSGLTGVLGDVGEMFGTTALSAGGAEGLSAGAGAALTGELGAGAALGSAGAVVGSGLAGYGLGRLLDVGVGRLGQAITGNRNEDYSISGLLARGAGFLDRHISSLWTDSSRPAYEQTIGWKLGDLLGRIGIR